MMRLPRFLWETILWLASPRRFWAVVLTLLAACLLCGAVPFRLETNIRWAGLVLQLYGLLAVMLGLVGREKLFKAPNPIGLVREWAKARPRWRAARTVQITGQAAVGTAAGLSMAIGRAGIAPGAPLEMRMDLVERQIADIYKHELPAIRKTQEESEQRVTMRVDALEEKANKRMTQAEATMKDATAKDTALEWVGVILLTVGVVLSTIAPELAELLGAKGTPG